MFHKPKEGTAGQEWGLLTRIATKGSSDLGFHIRQLLSFVQLLFTFRSIQSNYTMTTLAICVQLTRALSCHCFQLGRIIDWVQTIS